MELKWRKVETKSVSNKNEISCNNETSFEEHERRLSMGRFFYWIFFFYAKNVCPKMWIFVANVGGNNRLLVDRRLVYSAMCPQFVQNIPSKFRFLSDHDPILIY